MTWMRPHDTIALASQAMGSCCHIRTHCAYATSRLADRRQIWQHSRRKRGFAVSEPRLPVGRRSLPRATKPVQRAFAYLGRYSVKIGTREYGLLAA